MFRQNTFPDPYLSLLHLAPLLFLHNTKTGDSKNIEFAFVETELIEKSFHNDWQICVTAAVQGA